MIQNKNDLIEYLNEDKRVMNTTRKRPSLHQVCWKYLILLRKAEYYTNTGRMLKRWYQFRLNALSIKTGIYIPINTFGKGLALPHYGTIIVNGSARFGDYCVIQAGVNVAAHVCGGDFVYLAPGAKINENLTIADHVIVGSNCVLTHSVSEEGCTMAGVPAKKISNKGFYR